MSVLVGAGAGAVAEGTGGGGGGGGVGAGAVGKALHLCIRNPCWDLYVLVQLGQRYMG